MPHDICVFEPALTPSNAFGQPPLQITGASEGLRQIRALSAQFMCKYPEKTVLVPPGVGSGGGVAAVAAGNASLARISRPLNSAERSLGLVSQMIFRIPIAVYAHPTCGVERISSDDLSNILAGRILNWSELGRVSGQITVVGLEANNSSLGALKQCLPGVFDFESNTRTRISITEQNSLAMVEEISGAIGFSQYSAKMKLGTQVLKIDGKYPTDFEYPIYLGVSLVWRDENVPKDVQSFLAFLATKRAKTQLSELDVVPVSSPVILESVTN